MSAPEHCIHVKEMEIFTRHRVIFTVSVAPGCDHILQVRTTRVFAGRPGINVSIYP